jgi:hypothetical protein
MPTSALTKFHPFLEAAFEKKHNLGSDSLVVWLSNVAPAQANAVLTDITQVSYTNMSSRAVTISSSSQTTGTYSLILADLTLTMSGGASPSFRYIGVYNDTATNDDLVGGYYDYGSSISLADGESLVIDFAALGLFTAV